MNIAEIYEMQYQLQKSMGYPGTSSPYFPGDVNEQGGKEMLLAAMVECSEALGEFSWKPWKPEGYKPIEDKMLVATELMDIIQFVMNAAIYLGLNPIHLEDALRAKWEENDRRVQDGETTTNE